MKLLTYAVIIALVVSMSGIVYAAKSSDDSDSSGESSAGSALQGALMGGLLGGGLGAAIGSASGNAGKGALIGAGVGAVGGTLLKASADKQQKEMQPLPVQQQVAPAQSETVKKRVIRHFDEKGNVVSEEELKN